MSSKTKKQWLRDNCHSSILQYIKSNHHHIPNCLTIASTSYQNYFQYASVPLTELINENALSLTTNLSIFLLKQLLTVPAVSVPSLILSIAKFIDERKGYCLYTDLEKKYIISVWCKVLIKVQQTFIKVPSRTYWNNLPLTRT